MSEVVERASEMYVVIIHWQKNAREKPGPDCRGCLSRGMRPSNMTHKSRRLVSRVLFEGRSKHIQGILADYQNHTMRGKSTILPAHQLWAASRDLRFLLANRRLDPTIGGTEFV